MTGDVRAAGSVGVWQRFAGGRPGLAALTLVLMLCLGWVAGVALGGEDHAPPHWFYLPVMLAGLRFGRMGCAGAGVAAMLLAGPLLPADVESGAAQLTSDWVTRGAFFIAIGQVMTGAFGGLARAHDRELEQAVEVARVTAELRANAAQAEMYEHQAQHDGLTGLPNRLLFGRRIEEQLGAAAASGQPFAVMLLDLDRFKEINDTLGHHVGDRLLEQIGPRLLGVLRPNDVVARLGGDEFAILLPHSGHGGRDPETACAALAKRLMTALREPFTVDGLLLAVEASAGLALYPQHGVSAEELVQRADIAMYLAKAGHEGFCFYNSKLDEHSPRKLALLAGLRTGISRGELVVHYQPTVDLDTGAVQGVEALVRWRHPTEGLLPPGEFIPLAESSGLIDEVTSYVLDQALAQCRIWLTAGDPLRISVNVSARSLLDVTLPDRVSAALLRHDVPATLLELEITESAVLADPVRATAILSRLQQLGVSVSIDDFGTGYTSLSYLRDLPVNELKIDRSFVGRMLTSSKDAIIVRTSVELARRLGLRTVAEGVEDESTWRALQALNCELAQGFLVARPLPPEELTPWLSNHRRRPAIPQPRPETADVADEPTASGCHQCTAPSAPR